MEEYGFIDVNNYLSEFYSYRIPIYNTDPIYVDLDENHDIIDLFNDRSSIGVSDMSDIMTYLATLKKFKQVSENNFYENGLPKSWDSEDIG